MPVKILREPADAKVDIVLVPGWRKEGQQPWTHVAEGKTVSWPEAFLGDLVPQARIIAFDYKAKLGSFWAAEGTNLIDSLSDDLFWALKKPRAKTLDRKVIFVAHSIGGLLCENLLVKAKDGTAAEKQLAKCVVRMALLGTPFHTDKALWGQTGDLLHRLTGDSPGARSLRDDAAKSEKLAWISGQFKGLVEKTPLEVAVFYEAEESTTPEGDGVLIAGLASVKIPGAPNPTRLGTTHQGMAEAASEDDDHFERISRVLVGWAEELAEEEEDDGGRGGNHKTATFKGDNIGGMMLGFNDGEINGIYLGAGAKPQNPQQG